MDKEKVIQEMAKVLCDSIDGIGESRECKSCGGDMGWCVFREHAKELYEAGYCKAVDVCKNTVKELQQLTIEYFCETAEEFMYISLYDENREHITNILHATYDITTRAFDDDNFTGEGISEEDINDAKICVLNDENGNYKYACFVDTITPDKDSRTVKGLDFITLWDTEILLDYTEENSFNGALSVIFTKVKNLVFNGSDVAVNKIPVEVIIPDDNTDTTEVYGSYQGTYQFVNAYDFLLCYLKYYGYIILSEYDAENGKITITVKKYESYDSSSNTGEIADNAGWEDLVTLSNVLGENFEGATIKLENDITITKITDTETSNSILDFQGTFNGNGKTITIAAGGITPVYGEDGNGYLFDEMYESSKGQYDQYYAYGLFAAVTNGGTVKNLSVTYADTTASATDPESKRTYFGGIVGFLGGDSTISYCSVSGAIVQYNRVGGIVGTGVAGTIENCTVTADITSCKSSADSDGSYSYAAGIVGIAIAEFSTAVNNIYVKNCVIGPDSGTMSITTDGYAGGITARITLGITEFNVTDTTIQNVTITTTLTTSDVGAVCGGLYVENGLTGSATVKNVTVTRLKVNDANLLYIANYATSGTETSSYLKKVQYSYGALYTSNVLNDGILIIVGYYQKTPETDYIDSTYVNANGQTTPCTYYKYTAFTVTYTATSD